MPVMDREVQHTSHNIKMLVALVSIFFFGLIAYGYYNLSLSLGWFVAIIIGLLAALVAWWLARFVGENWSLTPVAKIFGLLLYMISGAGILNTLMLTTEGSHILIDTTYQSDGQITALQNAARRAASATSAAAQSAKVDELTESLISEIRNPLNCGQGPAARRYMAELQRLLPGFTPLSGTRADCSHNSEVIDDYRTRINDLKAQAGWEGAGLLPIAGGAEALRANMAAIRLEIQSHYAPPAVRHFVDELETQNGAYQQLRSRLASASDAKDVPESLPLTAAQNLGNLFGLFSLIAQRAGEARTWVLLFGTLAIDWAMCTLFAQNRKYRATGPHPRAQHPDDY